MLSIIIKLRNQECLQNVIDFFVFLSLTFFDPFTPSKQIIFLKKWKWRKFVKNSETKIIMYTHFRQRSKHRLRMRWSTMDKLSLLGLWIFTVTVHWNLLWKFEFQSPTQVSKFMLTELFQFVSLLCTPLSGSTFCRFK